MVAVVLFVLGPDVGGLSAAESILLLSIWQGVMKKLQVMHRLTHFSCPKILIEEFAKYLL